MVFNVGRPIVRRINNWFVAYLLYSGFLGVHDINSKHVPILVGRHHVSP